MLQAIVETALDLTGATYAALGVLEEGGERLETFITVGIDEERRREIGELPTGRGILGVLTTERRPVRLRDLNQDPRAVGFPSGHPVMRSFLGVPIVLRGRPYGNLYLTEKRGAQEFSKEDENIAELFASQAAIAIENARLYEAGRRWSDQLESLLVTSNTLSRDIEPSLVRQAVVEQLRDLVSAESAVLILRTPAKELRIEALAGSGPASLIGTLVDPWASKWGRVLNRGQAERVGFAVDDPEFDHDRVGRALQARAVILLPMVVGDTPLGVLAACNPQSGTSQFTDADLRVGELLADRSALALDLARRVERDGFRRALNAQEDERRRIARELHDETGQALTSILLGIGTIKASETVQGCHEAAERVNELARDALENVRRLAFELRPKALDDFGLDAALSRLAERLNELGGVSVDLEVQLDRRLAPDIESALYRTVQEALTNVIKHAGATRASVQISCNDGLAIAVVEDDGSGFDTVQTASDGFGLVAMRERLGLLGGELHLESASGRGTTVHATIPLSEV